MGPEMTSPILATRNRPTAFTLVELLIVIGVIGILVGILIPTVIYAMKKGARTKLAADLQAIAAALDHYKADHGDYPRPDLNASNQWTATGAVVLGRALVGPAAQNVDGKDGPGFRLRGTQGRVYGPYIELTNFKMNGEVILDSLGNPILYYIAPKRQPDLGAGNGYAADNYQAMYDYGMNRTDMAMRGGTPQKFQWMLGDLNNNGAIDGDEVAVREPFLLWTTGEDKQFGPLANYSGARAIREGIRKCDDVGNFINN